MFDHILLEHAGPVATLTINRPDKRNAITNATVEEIDRALGEIESSPELRIMVLTGAGEKAFVAGADIQELDRRDFILGRNETRRRQEVYTRIEQLEIPSIAAINGWALGTGLELAMACTLRVAAVTARMGQPEVKLGIIPGAGGSFRLPRLVGMGRALEMILTGEPITAEQALSWGLVNRIAEPEKLMEAVKELADKIIALPGLAVQYAKEAVLKFGEGSMADRLAHESYLHALSCATGDKKEGVAAFLEKRTPHFRGK